MSSGDVIFTAKLDTKKFNKDLSGLKSQGERVGSGFAKAFSKAFSNLGIGKAMKGFFMSASKFREYAGDIGAVATVHDRLVASTEKLAQELSETSQYTSKETEEYKALKETAKGLEAELQALLDKEEALKDFDTSSEGVGQVWDEVQQQIVDVINELEAYDMEMRKLEESGKAYQPSAAWENMRTQWERQKEAIKETEKALEGFNGVAKGQKVRGALGKLFGGLKNVGSMFKNVGKNARSSGNSISHGMGMGLRRVLGLIGAGSLLYKVFQYVREGMGNLVKYDKATANAVNSLTGALTSLKNALASAFAPILQAIEPILTKFIGMLTSAANSVAMFFSALTGKKVSVVATKVSSGIDGIGSAASGANDSAKELQRTLMGFDKINKLDSDNGSGSGGGGGGGSGGGGGGFTTLPVTEDAIDWADKFKESWEKADFYWLGELIANKINDALEKIPWDKINEVLQKVAKSIGTFLNGFVENLDWTLLGQTISNGIKAGLDFALTLLDTINWEAVGTAIVDFLVGIDWVGIFKRVFLQLPTAITTAVLDVFKGAFKEIIPKVVEMIPDEFKDALGDVGDVFESAFDNLKSAFVTAFDNIKADLSFGINTDTLDKAKEKLDGIVEKWDSLKTTTKNLTLGIVDKFSSKWKDIKKNWDNIKKKFSGKTASITIGLKNNFSKAWKKVKKAWNGIKSKTATIKLKFTEGIKNKWNAIAKKVNTARAKGGLAKTLLPNMPYLAQGGYVKRNAPQLAMIGDNKHEGEIVAPESKLQEMANKASQNPQVVMLLTQILGVLQTLDTNVYLDGEAIKNNTVRRINNHTRATGRLELII